MDKKHYHHLGEIYACVMRGVVACDRLDCIPSVPEKELEINGDMQENVEVDAERDVERNLEGPKKGVDEEGSPEEEEV